MAGNDNPIFSLESGIDSIHLIVDKQDVETGNLTPTLNVLRHLLVDVETSRRFYDRLVLGFSGYDQDPRELPQIPELRNFILQLDKEFPFWFFFMNLERGTLNVIQASLCRSTPREGRFFEIDRYDFAEFLTVHFAAMNWLMEKCGLGEDAIEERSTAVSNYFEGLKKPRPIH